MSSALGHTYAAPLSRASTNLPAGDVGVSCEYIQAAPQSLTIVSLGTGPVSVPFITQTEAAEKQAAAKQHFTLVINDISGVGMKAALLDFERGGAVTEDDLLAYSGQTGVGILVSPAATQSQLEALANQLLG